MNNRRYILFVLHAIILLTDVGIIVVKDHHWVDLERLSLGIHIHLSHCKVSSDPFIVSSYSFFTNRGIVCQGSG